MPFPEPGTAWPPTPWYKWYAKMSEWAAWYSGDPQELLNLYTSSMFFSEATEGRFWQRIESQERQGIVHLPAAGSIAATSADLLFSESPEFAYRETLPGADRLKAFIRENGIDSLLLESAELTAALSGVFLKLDADPGLLDLPIVTSVSPLQVIPVFDRGWLTEVLFWRVAKQSETGDRVWRLMELRRRDNGQLVIEYKLYEGTGDKVGRPVNLASIDETKSLGLVDMVYPMNALGCVYVPNMRPNRLYPGTPIGINDYNGCITLLDSLDFAWTSWMRDIELGLGQVLVDSELLERSIDEVTGESTLRLNKFNRAFLKLDMSSWRLGGENVEPIKPIQFELRVEEHRQTCETMLFQIVSMCGYSPQSFGMATEGRAESGTALRIRERKSLMTRGKKARYWEQALLQLFKQAQMFDVASGLAKKNYEPVPVDITMNDSVITDPRENSEVMRNLEQALAVSTWTKVKMVNPDWDDAQVAAEVKRINDERGAGLTPYTLSPTGGGAEVEGEADDRGQNSGQQPPANRTEPPA